MKSIPSSVSACRWLGTVAASGPVPKRGTPDGDRLWNTGGDRGERIRHYAAPRNISSKLDELEESDGLPPIPNKKWRRARSIRPPLGCAAGCCGGGGGAASAHTAR